MTDTRAEAAYRRSSTAFKNPTLDLLHGRHAPFVVAALSLVFTVDRPTVPVADAHAEVDEAIAELRAAGYDDEQQPRLPSGTAREICRNWVRVGWLVPQIDGDLEVYRLSAHAVGALEIAGRAAGGRTRVSRSRVRTLLEAVDRLAHNAEADPARRLERLIQERDALDAQIRELREGGDPELVDDEQLLEEAENVVHLARELPADFARVAESIKAMQRDVIADLRRDVRPTGEVLREYLQRGQHVMRSTPEGRAFAGALRLIGDPEHIDHLATQLRALQAQPFASLMDDAQRAELDAIGRRVELGVQEVLTAQRRASHVITAQVRTHDPVRDRQVDELLRSVMSGLQAWMQDSRAGGKVEPLRGFPVADIGHLRQTTSDIRPPGAPAPLAEAGDDVEFPDGDPHAWGGPRYSELESYVAGLGDRFDLGAAFEEAADETRRPVDLLGLLEIVHRGGMEEQGGVSVVEALRPDGTTRRFAFGAVTARTAKQGR
jgi:outer membrane murein-binding lipoprotein Lpp